MFVHALFASSLCLSPAVLSVEKVPGLSTTEKDKRTLLQLKQRTVALIQLLVDKFDVEAGQGLRAEDSTHSTNTEGQHREVAAKESRRGIVNQG